jgi:hypothetical protein
LVKILKKVLMTQIDLERAGRPNVLKGLGKVLEEAIPEIYEDL